MKHRNEEEPENADNSTTTDRTNDEAQNEDWKEEYNQGDWWYYEDGHANIEDGYQNEGRGWYEEEENAEYFLE